MRRPGSCHPAGKRMMFRDARSDGSEPEAEAKLGNHPRTVLVVSEDRALINEVAQLVQDSRELNVRGKTHMCKRGNERVRHAPFGHGDAEYQTPQQSQPSTPTSMRRGQRRESRPRRRHAQTAHRHARRPNPWKTLRPNVQRLWKTHQSTATGRMQAGSCRAPPKLLPKLHDNMVLHQRSDHMFRNLVN